MPHFSQHFNPSTNLRQSWTSQFSGLTLTNVPLPYLGFRPAMTGVAFSLNLIVAPASRTPTKPSRSSARGALSPLRMATVKARPSVNRIGSR